MDGASILFLFLRTVEKNYYSNWNRPKRAVRPLSPCFRASAGVYTAIDIHPFKSLSCYTREGRRSSAYLRSEKATK